MREILIWLTAAVYGVSAIFLCAQLIRIHRNPEKFDEIPGFERYKRSRWFWPKGAPYYKGHFVERVLPTSYWLIVVLLFGYLAWIGYVLGYESVLPCDTFQFGGYIAVVPLLGVFVGVICLVNYLAMFSRSPRDICFVQHHLAYDKTMYETWRRYTIYVLIFVVLGGAFHVWSMTNGGYVNDEEITYYRGISSERTVFRFDECEVVAVQTDAESGEVCSYVIENPSGQRMDLCDRGITFLDKFEPQLWEFADERIEWKKSTLIYALQWKQ